MPPPPSQSPPQLPLPGVPHLPTAVATPPSPTSADRFATTIRKRPMERGRSMSTALAPGLIPKFNALAPGKEEDLAMNLRTSIGLFAKGRNLRQSTFSVPMFGMDPTPAAAPAQSPLEAPVQETLVIDDRVMETENAYYTGCIEQDRTLEDTPGLLETILEDQKEVDNPYADPCVAEKLKADPSLTEIPYMRLLSDKCKVIETNLVMGLAWVPYKAQRTLTFDSERGEKGLKPTVEVSFSALGSYLVSSQPPKPFSPFESSSKVPSLEEVKYMSLEVNNLTPQSPPIEPLFVTGILYNITLKKFISEEWQFCPPYTPDFYAALKPPLTISMKNKAVFELPNADPGVIYVIFIFSHVLTVDANAPINEYYVNKAKKAAAEKNKAVTWPRNTSILTEFCWSYLQLSDILEKPSVTLPNPWDLSEPLTGSHLKGLIEDTRKSKSGKYPITVTLSVGKKAFTHETFAFAAGYDVVRLADGPHEPVAPSYTFQHKLQIRLDSASVSKAPSSTKARNVFAVVHVGEGHLPGDYRPWLRSKRSPELVDQVHTRCWYHMNKKAVFDELVVIELPIPTPQKATLVVEFFHAIAKVEKGQKDADRIPIGKAVLPLYTDNTLLKQGPHQVTIDYTARVTKFDPDSKVDSSNALSLTIWYESSLITPEHSIDRFFQSNGVDVKALESADPKVIGRHYFRLLDMLLVTVMSDTRGAIEGIVILSEKGASSLKKGEGAVDQREVLDLYANIFACRAGDSTFHRRVMDGYHQFLASEPPRAGPRRDRHVLDFLLFIILKSLYITKDTVFGGQFADFVSSFSRSLAAGHDEANVKYVTSFARFLVVMFDMHLYAQAVIGISVGIRAFVAAKNYPCLREFVTQSFRPRLFYIGFVSGARPGITTFYSVCHELLGHGKTGVPGVFDMFINTFWFLTEECRHVLVNQSYDMIDFLSPLGEFAGRSSSQEDGFASRFSPQMFFAFYIGQIEPGEAAVNWWISLDETASARIFKSLHYLLSNVTFPGQGGSAIQQKEMTYAVQCAILNFIRVIYGSESSLRSVTAVMYHFLCVNLAIDVWEIVIAVLCELIIVHCDYVFRDADPALPKFVIRLFKASARVPNIQRVFEVLFDSDDKLNNDNERSMSVCCRALAELELKDLQGIKLESENAHLKPIQEVIKGLLDVATQLDNRLLLIEDKQRYLVKRITLLKPSPDVFVAELQKLVALHQEADYFEEEIQTKMLIAAVIVEYLTMQRRIIPFWGTLHPYQIFSSLCGDVALARYPRDECPRMATFCESPIFSFRSFIVWVQDLRLYCITKGKGHEQGIELLDIMWPVYERFHMYPGASLFFKFHMALCAKLADIPPDTDRLFGHFFRVAFFGKEFGENDGCTFIYREKNLTHLYELTGRLQNEIKALYGKPIELIKESGKVDPSKLQPDLLYVQLTFVEPHFSKREQATLMTSYDLNHKIKTFYFDTPFTKGSDKAQGDLDKQWLRRTLLSVDTFIPCICKMALVRPENIDEREYMPVRVAHRMLRSRVVMMEKAVAAGDNRQIQQLLHGSLLVQVNEGPSKMAEVFLANKSDDKEYTKYAEKLRDAFRDFLEVNKRGLAKHGQWVRENPAFRVLQDELESGYIGLEEKLADYVK